MPLLQTLGAASARAFGFTRGSAGGATAMTLISTQVLASPSASITFSSIPQTYKHLQLRMTIRTSDTGNYSNMGMIRLNGVSATNSYSYHELSGNGGGVVSSTYNSAFTDAIYFSNLATAASTSFFFSGGIVTFTDYTNSSKNPVLQGFHGVNANGNTTAVTASQYSGMLLSASNITSINISSNAGNLATGCRFSLYGIAG